MIRLAVRVSRREAETVLAELLALSPVGLEEVDCDDGTVEYAIYGSPGELPALPDLQAAAGDALVEVSTSELPDDWSERWRQFHVPVSVGHRIRVRPPWSPAGADASLIDIVVDPGQAFGTGAHATTRLCLELLLGLQPGGALLDVGCGSGVLAIAAAKLGWGPVIAIDNDRASVAATLANADANDVTLDVRRVDVRRDALPYAPTAIANLLAPLLVELSHQLVQAAAPEALIAGGLLTTQTDAVAAEFAAAGFVERQRRKAGEWAALLLMR